MLMNISDIDIHSLLPQKEPFVMIDKLLQCDKQTTITSFVIKSDNLFFDKEVFTESGIVENIAQTCAARLGYINSVLNSSGVKIGFIGSVKNLNLHRLPLEDERLETRIDVQDEIFNIVLVKATVRIADEVIADCEMKIAEQ